MTTARKSAAFLEALGDTLPAPKRRAAPAIDPPAAPAAKPAKAAHRAGLKHIGGYFGRDDVEKFAILRARLGLDNSELIKLAVDELFKKQQAQRVFGDG